MKTEELFMKQAIKEGLSKFYGANNPGFIYADTDSIHCDNSSDERKGRMITKVETSEDFMNQAKELFTRALITLENQGEIDLLLKKYGGTLNHLQTTTVMMMLLEMAEHEAINEVRMIM